MGGKLPSHDLVAGSEMNLPFRLLTVACFGFSFGLGCVFRKDPYFLMLGTGAGIAFLLMLAVMLLHQSLPETERHGFEVVPTKREKS